MESDNYNPDGSYIDWVTNYYNGRKYAVKYIEDHPEILPFYKLKNTLVYTGATVYEYNYVLKEFNAKKNDLGLFLCTAAASSAGLGVHQFFKDIG